MVGGDHEGRSTKLGREKKKGTILFHDRRGVVD